MGTLTSWNLLGHSSPVTGLLYLYLYLYFNFNFTFTFIFIFTFTFIFTITFTFIQQWILTTKYSETCLRWPPTFPVTVVNISKWSTYTNVSQNNFQPYSYFISCLIHSQYSTSAVLNLYSI